MGAETVPKPPGPSCAFGSISSRIRVLFPASVTTSKISYPSQHERGERGITCWPNKRDESRISIFSFRLPAVHHDGSIATVVSQNRLFIRVLVDSKPSCVLVVGVLQFLVGRVLRFPCTIGNTACNGWVILLVRDATRAEFVLPVGASFVPMLIAIVFVASRAEDYTSLRLALFASDAHIRDKQEVKIRGGNGPRNQE